MLGVEEVWLARSLADILNTHRHELLPLSRYYLRFDQGVVCMAASGEWWKEVCP